MLIGALDPSFSNTGICIVNTESKTVLITDLESDCKKHKAFVDIQDSLHCYYIPKLQEILKGIDFLVSEEPAPFGNYSAGLYALDTAIIQTFYNIPHTTYNPRTLEKIHKTKRHTKEQSKSLAFWIIQQLIWDGYEIEKTSKKITHDSCEALLYAFYWLANAQQFFYESLFVLPS